ncbi:hypothetical protein NL676_021474 [Syzygium grande]|nr:hypothetical protein NL676_021474 [Syzygium grande]
MFCLMRVFVVWRFVSVGYLRPSLCLSPFSFFSLELQFLSQCFLHILSPSPAPCRQAESSLADAADRPSYALAILCLVAKPSVDEQIRQVAAVNFKNHLRARWASSPTLHDATGTDAKAAQAASSAPIPDAEKKQIKALIVPLMLSSSARIQTTHGAISAVAVGGGAGLQP